MIRHIIDQIFEYVLIILCFIGIMVSLSLIDTYNGEYKQFSIDNPIKGAVSNEKR